MFKIRRPAMTLPVVWTSVLEHYDFFRLPSSAGRVLNVRLLNYCLLPFQNTLSVLDKMCFFPYIFITSYVCFVVLFFLMIQENHMSKDWETCDILRLQLSCAQLYCVGPLPTYYD